MSIKLNWFKKTIKNLIANVGRRITELSGIREIFGAYSNVLTNSRSSPRLLRKFPEYHNLKFN